MKDYSDYSFEEVDLVTFTVKEIFRSIQGEGKDVGKECTFVRFSGCNLNCIWCDTDWHNGKLMSLKEVYDEIEELGCNYVVLTGGEPMIQKGLVELTKMLKSDGYEIGIETNGTIFVSHLRVDTLAISPKLASSGNIITSIKPLVSFFWEYSPFLKFVIQDETDMQHARNILDSLKSKYNGVIEVYFQPEFEKGDFLKLPEMFHKVFEYDERCLAVRFLPQVHKLIGIK